MGFLNRTGAEIGYREYRFERDRYVLSIFNKPINTESAHGLGTINVPVSAITFFTNHLVHGWSPGDFPPRG